MVNWYKGMVRRIRWNVRSWRCEHHYQLLGHHRMVSEDLYGCVKCGQYRVHHKGMGMSYTTSRINEKEWMVSLK